MIKLIKFVGQFIGPDKILKAKEASRKTYFGNPVIEVELEGGKIKEFPLKVLEEIVTKEKSDLSELREKRVYEPVKKILEILLESEMTIEDIKYLIQTKLPLSIENSVDRAYREMWGKEKWEVTLKDIDDILKGHGKQERKGENKKVSSSK